MELQFSSELSNKKGIFEYVYKHACHMPCRKNHTNYLAKTELFQTPRYMEYLHFAIALLNSETKMFSGV